jgi:glyoxylase-like metal-dependent hydrolase (beta-lactamase superfamily II)
MAVKHSAFVLLFLASPVAFGENVETLAERSHAQASAVLDRAVQALGGPQSLRSIEVVRLRLDGITWPRFQMPTPEPPFESATLRETVLVDFKKNRLALEQQGSGAGFENHNGVVIATGEGANYDHRARTMTPIPGSQSSQQQFVQYYRRVPHLLLRQAIDRRTSLRYLGTETFNGKPHEAFTFVMADTQQVAVYVDSATNLVSKYELVFVDPVAGDEVSEIVFGNYVSSGSQRVPTTWTWMQAGQKVADAKITVELNPAITDDAFKVAVTGYQQVEPLPDTLPEQVEKLADGVYVVHNVAGQNQNSMAVEFKDYIVVVEAPGSSDGADQVIERIKQTIPGKPIRYVAMTHHHGDHIGGLRSFIAEGAVVITTQANRSTVEGMAAAPQSDRLAKNPRAPQFALLEKGRRVLSDGTQRLELIDVGPNPHAKEMVIAYLPKQRIVFQGDLFFLQANDAPAGPPQETTLSFARKVGELKLAFDRIASVHGRTATKEEFERAVRQKQPT